MSLQNNAQILESPDDAKDRFYLTGQYDAAQGIVTIAANDPIIAQRQDDAVEPIIFRKHFEDPEERSMFINAHDNTRMLGVGGIVSVKIGGQDAKTILFEKTAGPSKGRMAQATGVADRHPVETLWTEISEETGILIVDRDARKLSLLCIMPQDHLAPVFDAAALGEELIEAKKAQFDILREQLPEEMKDWEIEVVRKDVFITPEDEQYLKPIAYEMPDGTRTEFQAIISDNPKNGNLNVMLPVTVELPEGTEILTLDPEKFMRPVQLFGRDELITDDFVANKSSVPMRPYLEERQATEQPDLTL